MSIQRTIDKYLECKKEQEKIRKEIQKYRKMFQARLKELGNEMDILSLAICDYLREHNHPAITYNGITIKLGETKSMKGKKVISRKAKENNLKNLQKNFNLSEDCVNAIHNSLLGVQETSTKISTSITKKMKK